MPNDVYLKTISSVEAVNRNMNNFNNYKNDLETQRSIVFNVINNLDVNEFKKLKAQHTFNTISSNTSSELMSVLTAIKFSLKMRLGRFFV